MIDTVIVKSNTLLNDYELKKIADDFVRSYETGCIVSLDNRYSFEYSEAAGVGVLIIKLKSKKDIFKNILSESILIFVLLMAFTLVAGMVYLLVNQSISIPTIQAVSWLVGMMLASLIVGAARYCLKEG